MFEGRWLAEKTSSPLMLGISGLVAYLPMTFFSPLAGIVADRYNRKFISVFSDMAMGAVGNTVDYSSACAKRSVSKNKWMDTASKCRLISVGTGNRCVFVCGFPNVSCFNE